MRIHTFELDDVTGAVLDKVGLPLAAFRHDLEYLDGRGKWGDEDT